MTRAQVLLAMAALALGAGCTIGPLPTDDRSPEPVATGSGGVPVSPSASPGDLVVAWNPGDTPAPFEPPPSLPATVGTPPCGTGQIEARAASFGGAGGSMAGGFLVRNTGPEACRLIGRPTVAIVDAGGRQLRATGVASDATPLPIVLAAGLALPADGDEAPAGLGSVFLVWSNWCGQAPTEPLHLVVTLPDGGVLRVPMEATSLPRCDEPRAPSTMSVGPFEATAGPDPTDPPAIPAEALQLTLEVPDHAVAGQVLAYVAILSNPTADPIELQPCPAFEERLNTRGGPVVVAHVLACAAVPSIAPGESVRFAMELDVPVDLPADPDAALVWALDPYGVEGFPPRGPEAKVPLPVVRP